MRRHRRVSCSPTRRAAAATGMPLTRVMTNASNRSVKPDPGRAHGTLTRRTPQSEQSMRATRACRKAWCWKKLRWRQVFFTVSCTGQSALPHSGQAKRPPVLKSISISSRFLSASNLASTTIHGGTRPSASWNRSISRMVSPHAPSSLSCRRPRGRQEQALAGARSSRVLDRHSTRRRIQRAAGAKGWLRRTEQKDYTKGKKASSRPGHQLTSARRPKERDRVFAIDGHFFQPLRGQLIDQFPFVFHQFWVVLGLPSLCSLSALI